MAKKKETAAPVAAPAKAPAKKMTKKAAAAAAAAAAAVAAAPAAPPNVPQPAVIPRPLAVPAVAAEEAQAIAVPPAAARNGMLARGGLEAMPPVIEAAPGQADQPPRAPAAAPPAVAAMMPEAPQPAQRALTVAERMVQMMHQEMAELAGRAALLQPLTDAEQARYRRLPALIKQQQDGPAPDVHPPPRVRPRDDPNQDWDARGEDPVGPHHRSEDGVEDRYGRRVFLRCMKTGQNLEAWTTDNHLSTVRLCIGEFLAIVWDPCANPAFVEFVLNGAESMKSSRRGGTWCERMSAVIDDVETPSRYPMLMEAIRMKHGPGDVWRPYRSYLAEVAAMYMVSFGYGNTTIGELLGAMTVPATILRNMDVASIHSMGIDVGRMSLVTIHMANRIGAPTSSLDTGTQLVSRHKQRAYEEFKHLNSGGVSDMMQGALEAPRRGSNYIPSTPTVVEYQQRQRQAPRDFGSVAGSVAHTSITRATHPTGNAVVHVHADYSMAETDRLIQAYLGAHPTATRMLSKAEMGQLCWKCLKPSHGFLPNNLRAPCPCPDSRYASGPHNALIIKKATGQIP